MSQTVIDRVKAYFDSDIVYTIFMISLEVVHTQTSQARNDAV
jgi:hypothetical protein